MRRTQIYLDETETTLLTAEAARTGATRSELIRRAIRDQYRPPTSPEQRFTVLKATAGARPVDPPSEPTARLRGADDPGPEPAFGTAAHRRWVAAWLDAVSGTAPPGPSTDEWMAFLRD